MRAVQIRTFGEPGIVLELAVNIQSVYAREVIG
jgi:hypothetical protein